jgi:hypothetical protein
VFFFFVPDPKPGKSKQAKPTTSWRKRHSFSTGETKVVRNSERAQTHSEVSKPSTVVDITSYADNSRDEAMLMCSNTGQQNSTVSSCSQPSIILESSQAKVVLVDSGPQEGGRDKLLGALNLKKAGESSLNTKGNKLDTGIYNESKMAADKSKSNKSTSEFILQNVDKYPPSPQLMTLVNLTKNLANSGRSPSTQIPGIIDVVSNKKCSETKVAQKLRETPQRTIFQSRTDANCKRMSLSTPRRQKHVRTLDFTTPPKARTIPKVLQPKEHSPKTIRNITKTLQRTASSTVSKARSSLFKSPVSESERTTVIGTPFITTVSSFSSSCSDNCHNSIPPIATRSPLPQLSGGWDNVAGVGQIICDDITVTGEATLGDAFESHLSVTETQNEKNLSDKSFEIAERTRMTSKLAEGSCMNNKSKLYPKKSWDSDLRALVNADFEGDQPSTNGRGPAKKNTETKKTRTTKMRRKSSQKTDVKVRRLKVHFNKGANMGSGGTNLKEESVTGESENIPSSLIIPINKSNHSSEKADLDTAAENQNRDLNDEGVSLVKGKSDLTKKSVEPASENDHTHVELKEKLLVKFSSQPKKCVSVHALNERKDNNQPIDLQDKQIASSDAEAVKETDGRDQAMKAQRKKKFPLEIAANKKAYLSKSSDSSNIGTVSSTVSVVSVLTMATSSDATQSPAVLKTAEKKTVHYSLHTHQSSDCASAEICVTHTDDPGNDTGSVAHASGIGCEVTGDTVTVTDDHHASALQGQGLVSSTSGICPTESQNKDLQTSQEPKSISGREPSFTKLPNSPPSKTSRTQKQVHDAVNKSDLQVRSATAPILDTPRKTDDPGSTCWQMHIPLTPRVMSPHPDDTPITKLASGNSCIDFSLIQTPSFPPTPNIAVTPGSCCSSQGTPPSYATRSTDYSSCSSYYKPSGRLDSCSSTKPLEELLIEECKNLENRIVVQETNKENASECADVGQCQPLPIADKTPEETTPLASDSLSDLQVTGHVEKELESCKAVEGLVDSLVGVPEKLPSPHDQKQTREKQKRGVTDNGSNSKPEEGNIATRKGAGSLFTSGNRDIFIKDRPSETYTLAKCKAKFVALADNKNSDFEGELHGTQTCASGSSKRKYPSISKKRNQRSNSKDKLSEPCTSASLSVKGNTYSECKNNQSETHYLAAVSTKRKARTGNKSSNYSNGPSGINALTSITTKRKASPISSPANKSSDLKDELSETQMNLHKEPVERTKNEIIQKHLEAARMKLFGSNSPSDDSDFESSSDFGQSEAENKTVSSNDGNNKLYGELTKAKQSSTRQEEMDRVIKSSNFCSTFIDVSNTDTQQMVASERKTDEVRPVSSRVALLEEKSPCVPASFGGAQIKKLNTDENVNCEALSCRSKIPRDEIVSDHNQPTDGFRKLSVHVRNNDSAGMKSHTSLSGKNAPLNNKLDEKKHCMIAELKGVDIHSSVPNANVNEPVEGDDEITAVKTVPDGMVPSTSVRNKTPAYVGQDIDARKQLRGKEENFSKTASIIPMKRKNDGESTETKKDSHLCVEAIAERLTKEKTAVQAQPMIQTPVSDSVAYEDSTSEDFPALHLSSDDETPCETIHLSEVESQVSKLHGGEETTTDGLMVRSPPRSVHDVCRDLEVTPRKLHGVESCPKLLQAVDTLENQRQELKWQEQLDTNKRKEKGVSRTSVHTNDCKILPKELSLSERQESINKNIRALLGNDVSPIKDLTEARKASKDKKRKILHKPPTTAVKDNSPIQSILETDLQEKKPEERVQVNSAVKKVHEIAILSKQNKVSDSYKVKKESKSHETCTNEGSDRVECRNATPVLCEGPSMEGMESLDTGIVYERHQVSDNEVYIGIVYADEGPKGNSLAFEDICKFSLTFELGEDSDGVVEAYKCTVSEFQELYSASPRQCTSESDSYENCQFDVKRKNTPKICKEDKHSGYVKRSEIRDKELFHKSRSVGRYTREHQTRSRSTGYRRSTDFSHYRMRTSRGHWRSPSPVHRRWALSSNHGRRSQSLDRRSPSSSPVLSTRRMSTFSPLNQLYSEYLRDERESGRFTSHCSRGDKHFSFRGRKELPFGQRDKGKAKYHDRHDYSKRSLVHSFRESSHTSSSSSSSSSYRMFDSRNRMLKHFIEHRSSANKLPMQEAESIETCSRRLSTDTASLPGTLSVAKDTGKEPVASYTQSKGAVDGKPEMQDSDESLEEGELVDEDSVQGRNRYKCDDKLVVRHQKYPSSGNFTRYLVQIAQIS